MFDDEVISTSDPEEKEEIEASTMSYWEKVATTLRNTRATYNLPTRQMTHDATEDAEAGPSNLPTCMGTSSKPPRKRRKVCHMRCLYLLILNFVIARPFRGKHPCSPSPL